VSKEPGAVHGRARATVLRENMESQIYYRPSDLATAKYLEDRLGTRSAYATSRTLYHSRETTSEGLSERPVSLLSSQDIAQLRDDQIIGSHRHYPPFRARRMDWRRFPGLAEKQKIQPPKLEPLPPLHNTPAPLRQTRQGTPGFIDPDTLGRNHNRAGERQLPESRIFPAIHPQER
jgi:type IV secretory pathway TraG/TraD family ATPase VirD4